jgi:peptidoglycan/LPS O-acetylase OafA/YrhL
VFTHVFIIGVDWRLSFADYPALHREAFVPYLQQAWALGPELAFYALAPILLRRPALLAGVLVASVALRIYLVPTDNGFNGNLRYHFLGSTICFFLMGHVARLAGDRFAWLSKSSTGGGMLVIAVLAMVLPIGEQFVDWDSIRFWVAISAFALSLPGVFAATKDHRLSNFLGDLSFGVYLLNTGLIRGTASNAVLSAALQTNLPPTASSAYALSAVFVASTMGLAYLVYGFIEKPVAGLMRRVIPSWPGREARSALHRPAPSPADGSDAATRFVAPS